MTLYIWFLLTLPSDRSICSLWVNQPPTQTALVQACGTEQFAASYRVDVLYVGKVICSMPIESLGNIAVECALTGRLDQYRMNIVEPNYQTLICSVSTEANIKPNVSDVKTQCPQAPKNYELRIAGTQAVKPKDEPTCLPPAITQPSSIATTEDYYLLAGKLIWYGYAKSNCAGGLAGVNPVTFAALPCGMDGARAKMIDWQNSMDAEIISAASMWNVPAALLKQMIADETQFWTWTGVNDEHGLIQITEDGAGVVLHFFDDNYYHLNPKQQHSARIAWLQQLDCLYCTPLEAIDHARQVMPLYAQALAAYYCMFGSWDAALRAWNVKHRLDI